MVRPPLERLPYFKFHPADYLIDTSGLTLAEHGAYTLLLLNYYWSGMLPDQPALYSVCGARDEAGRAAVDLVLARYFHNENGRIVHHRVERELSQYGEMIRTNQAAGRRSAEVRAAKRVLAPKQTAKARANGADRSAGFDAFYAAYPRHKKRADAEKAWAALHPDDALQARILAAVAIQRTSHDWTKEGGKYTPYPASWIRSRQWEDEIKPGAGVSPGYGPEFNPDGSRRPAV